MKTRLYFTDRTFCEMIIAVILRMETNSEGSGKPAVPDFKT